MEMEHAGGRMVDHLFPSPAKGGIPLGRGHRRRNRTTFTSALRLVFVGLCVFGAAGVPLWFVWHTLSSGVGSGSSYSPDQQKTTTPRRLDGENDDDHRKRDIGEANEPERPVATKHKEIDANEEGAAVLSGQHKNNDDGTLLVDLAASDDGEQRKWEAVHLNKKLPLVRDISFLDGILGERAVGKYPRTPTTAAPVAAARNTHDDADVRQLPQQQLRTFDDMLRSSLATEHYVHNKPLAPQNLPLRPCDPSIAPFTDAVAHSRCSVFLRNVLGAAFKVASTDGYTNFTDEFEVRLNAEYRWVLREAEGGGGDGLVADGAGGVKDGFQEEGESLSKGAGTAENVDGSLSGESLSIAPQSSEERGETDTLDTADDATLFYVTFFPLLPKFEQRTIKYRCEIWNKRRTAVIGAIIKVPQMLFPREPFSEIMAHRLDRLLGINRIPPIAMLPIDVEVLRNISRHRKVQKVVMDEEFLKESRVTGYDEWIDKDLFYFVRNNKGIHYVGPNKTHVFITVQLFLNEVRPLLESQLIVPYSKKTPGWHRWFTVGWNELPINNASLYALSELAIFDFITMNDDRSPNKNNFAIGGCKRCAADKRRPSGMMPTIVHLDQGMSQWGSGHILSHSPIGKQRDKVKFCIFYKPLMASIYQRLRSDGDNLDNTRRWFLQNAHPAAVRALGKGLLGEVAEQMWRVVRRLLVCLKDQKHTPKEVLRPNEEYNA